MKAVCAILIVLALATAASAESMLYAMCKNDIALQDREKKEGICGACFNEEFKRLCDELEKKQKDHFPGEFAIVRGLLSCGYAKCQLTEEYCERNKATFDRLSPQKR
uniref:Saposin B-type domain-containing protein n=1 Tax=Bursaphelenchus xylophilus TaxID=6326 RepID=A0A1I7RID3_BURXY